jgi:hypothetical protein
MAALFCRAKYLQKRIQGPHCRNVQKRRRGVQSGIIVVFTVKSRLEHYVFENVATGLH